MKRHLPIVSSSQAGDVHDPERPVLADISWVSEPHLIEPHSHLRGQLVYAASGCLKITSGGPVFIVPPQFAAWIPPGITHAVTASEAIHYCSLFIDETASGLLPKQAQLLHLTPLVKELTRTAAGDDHSSIGGAEERLQAVMLDQLQRLKPAHVALPIPASGRLSVMVEHFLHNPGESLDVSYWTDRLSMCERTLLRVFRKETGLAPLQWLLQLKVLKAIELIEAGETVKGVAYEMGYSQSSAFISMFKKVTGRTPASYRPGSIYD